MIENPSVHAQAARSIALTRAHLEEHFIQPLLVSLIETAWMHGALPLPDLNWGLREPWFRGDVL